MEQFEQRTDLTGFSETVNKIKSEIKEYIVGQEKVIDQLIIALLADGHVLIEGVPGLAKTLLARVLAKVIDVDFKRIQFTPDLLPSDIIGTSIFNMQESKFHFNKGPLFSNIILADEINRSPAKTQSALFEAMEERQISVDGTTYPLKAPFLVLATQNPVDMEGTYRLPEAQIDRFLFKITVDYPSLEEETKILSKHQNRGGNVDIKKIKKVLLKKELQNIREIVKNIHVEDSLIDYIGRLVIQTRNNSDLFLAASPRASIAILNASKAYAAMNGRDFVIPDDVKFVLPPTLIHRLVLSPEKEIDGSTFEDILNELIQTVEIPR
jgi:MoxR-like ATPase